MTQQSQTDAQAITAGLSIIHSNRMEDLRAVAVQWIRRYPLEPLENELFIVQSNGMAQWLKLALAGNNGCGISAALDFQLPARFVWNAYRAVLGDDAIPEDSPFDKERLIWRLMRLLPPLLQEEVFVVLRHYLAGDDDLRKRYQLACQLADLYDQYQVYRADWLEDWLGGADQLRNALGAPAAMPSGHVWQAELWRRIQADVPAGQRHFSRSRLHRRFLSATRAPTGRLPNLPRRVMVFGISSLPKQALEALYAVSQHSQVLMFVHNPCRHYWADIIEDRELLRIEHARHSHKSSALENLSPERLHQQVNPLLAAWGKQGRDYIGLLYGYDQPQTYREKFAEIDLFSDCAQEDQTLPLLRQVQEAILDLRPLPDTGAAKAPVADQDRSICFHLAYSRQREVEILQDQLIFYLEKMPDTAPQDIIVMTPDIDAYAAHIEAVFGRLTHDDPRYIPFTIADRPERTSVPMMQALEKLLHLPASRMAVSDLMDLLEVPAFRARFGLADDDLPKLSQWIEGAGIRWGLSAEQRRDFDLPAGIEQNSWRFGLRRMLLGYAVGAGDPWQGIEPFDGIGGLEAAIVGPLAQILEQLETYWRLLSRPVDARQWHQRILAMMDDFFRPANRHDELTRIRMAEVLEQWYGACAEAGLEEALTLPVVRQALMGAMLDSSVSQRFLAGRVNFCTLMPMRAIPFDVVCLLGMNDGEYPRSIAALDFDLMSGHGHYRPGDRSRREDDRYLFFEALLSARRKLYISYIGRSIQDDGERMPSVLVGQLREYLSAGWRPAEGAADAQPPDTESIDDPLLDQLTCRHPLQPFSRRYFQPLKGPDLFTYAGEWHSAHVPMPAQAVETRLGPPRLQEGLQLHHLIELMKNPVRFFLKQRLNIIFDPIDLALQDQEPFSLDGLAPFRLAMPLLNAALAETPEKSADAVADAVKRLIRAGELPHGGFGQLAARELTGPVQQMLEHHHELCRQWPQAAAAVELRLPMPLPDSTDRILEDWMDGLRCAPVDQPTAGRDPGHARWEFYPMPILDSKGRVGRLRCFITPWVHHLAGCARGLNLTSYLVAPDRVVALDPMAALTALERLKILAAYWWRGLCEPLPVTAGTALAFLTASPDREEEGGLQSARQAARKAYEGDGHRTSGELGYGDGDYLRRIYPDFQSLWHARDNAFITLAEELYGPMKEAVSQEESR